MFGLGTPELLIIGLGIVLLFGARKIPELMKGLGSGIKEFKKASSMDDEKTEVVKKNGE
ncbi:hypothetical protein MASR2M18_19810 [Ignavibacteria bacterium]|nr:twin-arginine translocase TatA/TatE family subunit [Bacteroidota bacterium]MCZ2131634.1 twin-arginine translocase TatA/TatE family subunit [Bacteroidota bacterium]